MEENIEKQIKTNHPDKKIASGDVMENTKGTLVEEEAIIISKYKNYTESGGIAGFGGPITTGPPEYRLKVKSLNQEFDIRSREYYDLFNEREKVLLRYQKLPNTTKFLGLEKLASSS